MEIKRRKRLHVHSLPLIAAVFGVTGFLALSVQAARGEIAALSVLRPALGVGSWLADTSAVKAALYDAPVVRVSAGAQVYVSDVADRSTNAGFVDGSADDPANVGVVTKAIALQMALNGGATKPKQ